MKTGCLFEKPFTQGQQTRCSMESFRYPSCIRYWYEQFVLDANNSFQMFYGLKDFIEVNNKVFFSFSKMEENCLFSNFWLDHCFNAHLI